MKKLVNKEKYIPRVIDITIDRYLSAFGAVCIEGPKWCGKSWTSSYHANSEILLADSSNNYQNKTLAKTSPILILEGETPRMIDEWQEVPALWDVVRYEIDKRGLKGQFILTGSSTPNKDGIVHSGVGRIAHLRMATMSLYESKESSGDISLQALCDNQFINKLTGEVNLFDLAKFVIRGGWPGNLEVGDDNITLVPKSYIESILKDDAQQLDEVKYDKHKLRLLLRSLARNESTTASNKKLLYDIINEEKEKIDIETVSSYLNLLERLFLIDNLQPFSTNIRSSIRVKQQEKRHFCDPSLAASLLNLTPRKLINDLNTFGFLFESLVERDLKIYGESFGAKLFHYQDYKGHEIDAVLELEDGRWCAFEIKLGAHQIDEGAKNLIKINNNIVSNGGRGPSVMCVICGMSNAAYLRDDGVYVVPITALKQ